MLTDMIISVAKIAIISQFQMKQTIKMKKLLNNILYFRVVAISFSCVLIFVSDS